MSQTPDADFVAQQMMSAIGELNHYREGLKASEERAIEYRRQLFDYEERMKGYERTILDLQRVTGQGEHVDTTLTKRGEKYGPFSGHADLTQQLKWTVQNAPKWLQCAPDQKEALEMICHKIGRILNGDPNYDDSWRDIAGYAMLVCNRLTGEGPK